MIVAGFGGPTISKRFDGPKYSPPCTLFCDLLSQVSSTLEHNISPELGRDFKLALGVLTDDLAALLDATLPDLDDGLSAELVVGAFVLVAGLWPAAHPPPEIIAAIDPEAGHEALDFDATLRRLVRAIFVGLPSCKTREGCSAET